MERAYSLLAIRSADDNAREIEGIASTPTPDRYDDIVEPMGAKFALPMPLLWQHRSDQPVGNVSFAKPQADGIPFKAQILSVDQPGALKERLDEAWQSVKIGLIKAVSIGFRPLEHAYMDNGGVRYLSWEWLELSLVTIPANSEATINTIRSIDHDIRAATGRSDAVRVVRLNQPARVSAEPFVIRTIHRSKK
jgi:HK97 family phage prohead protease